MNTLSGTSLTSEISLDKQMMEDTLPLGAVTLQRDKAMCEWHVTTDKLEQIERLHALKYICVIIKNWSKK